MIRPCAELPNDNPELHAGAVWVCLRVTGPAEAELPLERAGAVEEEAGAVEEEAGAVESVASDESVAAVAAVEEEAAAAVDEGDDVDEEDDVEIVDDLDGDGSFSAYDDPPREIEDGPLVVEELEPFEVVCEADAALGAVDAPPATESEPPPPSDPFLVLVCALADVAIAEGAIEAAELLPRLLGEGALDVTPSDATRAALEAGGVLRDGAVTPEFAARARAWRAILRGESEDFEAAGAAMLDEFAADLVARVVGDAARAGDLRRAVRARGVAAFGLVDAA